MDAEKVFFQVVQIGDVYGVIVVVWKSLHIIEDDPIHDKNREAKYEFTGNTRDEIHGVKYRGKHQLVLLKANQPPREQEIGAGNG